MKRKQKIEKRPTLSWSRSNRYAQVLESLPVIKSFDFKARTQDWNRSDRYTDGEEKFYINNIIQSFCEYLKDLFCIDYEIHLNIRPNKDNNSGSTWLYPLKCFVKIGAKGGIRATTLVHEFLHVTGLDHEYEINGYSDYRSTCTLDTYSPLIVKDIFGRKEVLVT